VLASGSRCEALLRPHWPIYMATLPTNEANIFAVLTKRERQIMGLVSEGLSNKEMGRRLNIANGTIKIHFHNIFEKLGVGNRTALAAVALKLREKVEWEG
jgi:two-component system nitrate/nitrite response regulator NarL